MYTKKQRISSMLACFALVIIMFTSSFFLVKEANHHCNHRDCPVCACILEAQRTIRTMGTVVIGALLALILPLLFLQEDRTEQRFFITYHTLISQKVRLND